MSRQLLLELVRKLMYRIRDLEDEKKQYLKEFSKTKENQLVKYQKMLVEVKEMREKSRLGMSAGWLRYKFLLK